MIPFLKTVGSNIRNIRNSKGLSMEALSNEANIEYRQLGRIERGEVNTTLISLLKIALILIEIPFLDSLILCPNDISEA